LGDDEDIGEDNGCINESGIALNGLEGECGGDFGRSTAVEKVAVSFGFVIFWEISAGYA
jgi:hypothetical protein